MVHAGQFAILKKKVDLPEYQYMDLKDGWILSRHQKVDAYYDPEMDILLLGIAWQVLPGKGTPVEEIKKLRPDANGIISDRQVKDMEESWNGRYILIVQGRIYLDASSKRCLFYSDVGVSSSCAILAMEKGYDEVIYQPNPVMNWMPGPLTHYDGIFRQLPCQIYNYRTGEMESRELLSENYQRIEDEKERVKLFVDLFIQSLRNMHDMLPEYKMLVALTGGHDSRALLAMAKKGGLPIEAYTLDRDTIFAGDVEYPPKLCEIAQVPYTFIPRDKEKYSAKREQEYYQQTSGLSQDQDRYFYAYDQYQELVRKFGKSMFLRSGVWTVTSEYMHREFTKDGPVPGMYEHYELKKGSIEEKSVQQYLQWQKDHPQKRIDLATVFAWEQDSACWLSINEQCFDLIDGCLSLQPMNCRLLISILMDFSKPDRMAKIHEERVTEYAFPELMTVPYGTFRIRGEKWYHIVKTKVERGIHRLRTTGLTHTVQTYALIFRKMREESQSRKSR